MKSKTIVIRILGKENEKTVRHDIVSFDALVIHAYFACGCYLVLVIGEF